MSESLQILNVRPNFEVANLDRAVAFYRDRLGFALRFRADEFALAVFGDEGGAELALQQVAAPAARSCYVNVIGVEALHERCRTAGLRISNPLTTHPWGMRDFVVHDPDGNMLAIGERVAPM